MVDALGRTIDYLRISITDVCNMQCVYCIPDCKPMPLTSHENLSLDEIIRICKCMASTGITKIKITGGEPLLYKELTTLVKSLKALPQIKQVTLTTNGVLLEKMIDQLVAAGLDGVNISLDTLNAHHFHHITRRDQLDTVLRGLYKTLDTSIPSVKLNCIAIEELNAQDLMTLVELARTTRLSVRFIELMPIGLGKSFTPIPHEKLIGEIQENYGELKKIETAHGNGPATYYELQGFKGNIGFISALSHEFCEQCNRVRLTAAGDLKLCLHYNKGLSLKKVLRSGVTDESLCQLITSAIYDKPLKHGFNEPTLAQDLELKNMVQIGG